MTQPEKTFNRTMCPMAIMHGSTDEALRLAYSTTPEDVARRKRLAEDRVATDNHRYQLVQDAAPAALLPVVELHRPRHGFGADYTECFGCDAGEHPASGPSWPCTTWLTIETQVRS